MSCIGEKLFAKLMSKVAVIDCLSDSPFIATCFVSLFDSIWLATGTYLRGVWSKLIKKAQWNNVPQDQRFDVEILALLPFLPIMEFLA